MGPSTGLTIGNLKSFHLVFDKIAELQLEPQQSLD